MPVTSTIIKESFLGNGDASTPYTFTFTYDDGNDIKVLIDGVATTAFTHSGNDIRTDVAVPNTSTVTIYRETPKIQTQPFPSNTTPAAEDVRAGFDKLTLIAQEQQEQLDRSVKPPIDTPFVNSSTIGLDSEGNFVSRTATEESTHLGIGASVAAAKVFADSAEEQAGFAHDERVLAEAAATSATAAQSLSSSTLLDLSTRSFPKVRIAAEVLGTITSDVTLTFPGGGSLTLKASARPYAEDNGINAEGNPSAVIFLNDIKNIINENVIDFDSGDEYGLEPSTTVSNYTPIPDWSAEFPVIDGVINTSKLDLTYYGGEDVTFTVPSPFVVLDGADLTPPAALPFGGGADPLLFDYWLVVGQSNVANGRAGGDMSANRSVEVFNYLSDGNDDGAGAWEKYDPSIINPIQVSGSLLTGSGNVRQEVRNRWWNGLAKRYQADTGRSVRVIQSAQSSLGLENWLAPADGGNDIMWNHMVAQIESANPVLPFRVFCFDQGESGPPSYATALTKFYNRLTSAGYIDSNTVIIAREINETVAASPTFAEVNTALAATFETAHGVNGYVVPKDTLAFEDAFHYTGESHDEVATLAWNHLKQVIGGYTWPIAQKVPDVGFLTFENTPLGNRRVAISDFLAQTTGQNLPSSPDALFYAADYDDPNWPKFAGSGLDFVEKEGDVNVFAEVLALDSSDTLGPDSAVEAESVMLSESGDWCVGLRIRFDDDGAQRNILSQYDGVEEGRMLFRKDADDTLRLFVGGPTGGGSVNTVETYALADGFLPVLIYRDGLDFHIVAKGVETSFTGANPTIVSQTFFRLGKLGGVVTGISLTKLAVYDKATTAAERTQLINWLSL